MKDLIIKAYRVFRDQLQKEKCSECDKDRMITYVGTNGKKIRQNCDCMACYNNYYVEEVHVLTDKGRALIDPEATKGEYYNGSVYTAGFSDDSFYLDQLKVYNPESGNQYYYNTIFLNKADAEQFAFRENKKEGNK